MDLVFYLIGALASFVSLYMFLCFARIIMTWIPQLAASKVGLFFAAICDPYLNSFSRIPFLRTQRIDFSPIVSLGVLVLVSSILSNIAIAKQISIGIILTIIIRMAWSIISGLLGFLNVLLIIRLIFNMMGRDTNMAVWVPVDNVIGPIVTAVSKFIHKNKFMTFRNSLITTLIVFVITYIVGAFLIKFLITFFGSLPF